MLLEISMYTDNMTFLFPTLSYFRFVWGRGNPRCLLIPPLGTFQNLQKTPLLVADFHSYLPGSPTVKQQCNLSNMDMIAKSQQYSHDDVMETFSAKLALCARNSPVTGEFPSQRPVTRNFDGFFDIRLNKRLSKQSWCWWFETSSCSLWRHCDDNLKNGEIVEYTQR